MFSERGTKAILSNNRAKKVVCWFQTIQMEAVNDKNELF
ncbi:hypothetical protein HNQ42_001785 [Rummeliibacillus stabekisii]|nr:hypothetical protein [Rummeliibacillus stabekisii]